MMFLVVGNRPTQETFLKARFVIFRCQKYVKKGHIELTKKIYLETLKKCHGSDLALIGHYNCVGFFLNIFFIVSVFYFHFLFYFFDWQRWATIEYTK